MSETTTLQGPINQELTIILEKSGLEKGVADDLSKVFIPFYLQAKQHEKKAMDILITGMEQGELLEEARKFKKIYQCIRVDADKKRKELKEDSLRTGRAIDGLFNVIKKVVAPIEEKLQKDVDFIKIQEKKKLDEMEIKRKQELIALDVDVTWFKLREMEEEKYEELLTNSKRHHKEKKEREAQEAKEREIEKELEAKENIRLAEKERKEREVIEVENTRLKDEKMKLDEKLKVEKKAIEKLEKELKDKEEADERKIEEARLKKLREEQEANRLDQERLKAPDKEKLKALELAVAGLVLPQVQSEKAKEVVEGVNKLLSKVGKYIRQNTINL